MKLRDITKLLKVLPSIFEASVPTYKRHKVNHSVLTTVLKLTFITY